jgi:diguanylate cyclase (GGDEF)-like protein/PAS domain S-box-containing protein
VWRTDRSGAIESDVGAVAGQGPVVEDRFRAIFDFINDGILIIAFDTHEFLDANQRACEMFGYDRTDLLKLNIDRLSAENTPALRADRAALRARATTGEAVIFEWHCRNKNGRFFWIEIAVRRAVIEAREVFLLTAHDITERHSSREGLEYRDRLLNAITLSIAELVVERSFRASTVHVLQAIGELLEIDRILVWEGTLPSVSFPASTSFVWRKQGLAAVAKDNIAPDEEAVFNDWFAPLLNGQPVAAYAGTSTGFVARLMDNMGALSLLLVPIEVEGTYWGQIVIADCTHRRRWTLVETTSLGTFAKVIGAVMARRDTQMNLRKSEAQFRAVGETMFNALILIGVDGRIRYWNRAAERIFGYSADEANGRLIREWITPQRFTDSIAPWIEAFVAPGLGPLPATTLETVAARKDGVEIRIELSLNGIVVDQERFAVAIIRDITDRIEAHDLIERMASHDALTGLPNRRLFMETIQQAIARAGRSGRGLAVLYLDLDHFKDVNDTLGHPTGDRLLQSVAERLRSNVREIDTVARFGGDEFAAIAIDLDEPADAAVLADKLVKALAKPFHIDDHEVRTGASIGIAVFGPDSLDAEALLAHADVALYRAKADGRGTYRFYTDAMDAEVRERVTMDTELGEALESGQFFLVYQPQVNIETGRIVGLEALVRWHHPTRGVLEPKSFLAAAEKSGAIVELGRFVKSEACRQMKRWLDAGIAPPLISVNVSGVQFKAPLELENGIATILAETGLAPQLLELELTESVLMEASLAHRSVLLRLREMGLRLAIDDFGTGYSSLDRLRRFRVDRIKIPESFIAEICTNSSDASIVRASFGLARELDIEVVAEGVENAAQLALLKTWGCRIVQGYYFSEPLGLSEATSALHLGFILPKRPKPIASA